MAHPKRRQSKTRTAFARIVASGMNITLFVAHAVIIEVNLQFKKRLLFKGRLVHLNLTWSV